MPRNQKHGSSFRMTSFMVEPEIYNEFLESIPRTKSVGEALREYMKSVVDEQKKEKALNSPNYSAVREINYINNKPSETFKGNSTLDIYLTSVGDIIDHVRKYNDTEDITILADLEKKGKVLRDKAYERKMDLCSIKRLKN